MENIQIFIGEIQLNIIELTITNILELNLEIHIQNLIKGVLMIVEFVQSIKLVPFLE